MLKAGAHTSPVILNATMRPAARTAAVLALLFVGLAVIHAKRVDYIDNIDLIRRILQKPWRDVGQDYWHRTLRIDPDMDDQSKLPNQRDEKIDYDDDLRVSSEKRSAVATALNASRRRREPAPALGKAVTSYIGVGVLSDVETFLDSLRDNLYTLASLSPQQRSGIFQETPTVGQAPPSSGNSGGSGFRKLHALRPLRPHSNIRSYNRRSFVEADGVYPGANHHDPGLLWTGLGR